MSANEEPFQPIEGDEEALSCHRDGLYEPLPPGKYIRVLLLEPGGPDDPIACKLNTIPLDEARFEAISYAWGTPTMTERISCNGKSIYITANLRDALVQARRKLEPRALWADSICINQEDNNEKGQQVALMADIYKSSRCTLICLGHSDAEAHALPAAGLIADVNAMMDRVFQDESFSWEPDSFPEPDPDEPLLSDARWESVATLTGQPWFDRAWVVQEAALGPDARTLWGDVENDWVQLLRAYTWGISRAPAIDYSDLSERRISPLHFMTFGLGHKEEAMALWGTGYHPSLTMLQTLDSVRSLVVTNERDRVYACLGLPNATPNPPEVTPTYHGSHLDIYREFACQYLNSTDMDLDILLFSQHNGESLRDTQFGSWIPRWDLDYISSTVRDNIQPFAMVSSHATAGVRKPSLVDQNTLKVQGIRIGTVRFVSETFTEETTEIETVRHVWQDATSTDSGIDQEQDYSPQASTLQALVQTLSFGTYDDPLKAWNQKERAYAELLRAEDGTKGDVTADLAQVHENIRIFTHNRRFIVTDRGYYGLAPYMTRIGDPVYAISGAKMVYILRETQRDHQYRLVGDCYMLSKAERENSWTGLGCLGNREKYNDWVSWGLEEEDVYLC